MWEYLQQRYQQSSAALRYSIRQNLQNLQQQDMSVEEFHSSFTRLSRQLDSMVPKACSGCKECAAKELYEEQNIMFDFVMRLRPDFEQIRGQLLSRTELPNMAVLSRLCLLRRPAFAHLPHLRWLFRMCLLLRSFLSLELLLPPLLVRLFALTARGLATVFRDVSSYTRSCWPS